MNPDFSSTLFWFTRVNKKTSFRRVELQTLVLKTLKLRAAAPTAVIFYFNDLKQRGRQLSGTARDVPLKARRFRLPALWWKLKQPTDEARNVCFYSNLPALRTGGFSSGNLFVVVVVNGRRNGLHWTHRQKAKPGSSGSKQNRSGLLLSLTAKTNRK